MIRFLFLLLVLIWPQVGQAGFLDNASLSCIDAGNCGLPEIVLGLIFLIRLMLGGMGAIALLYFVIGGLWWLTSAGAPDKVKKGKDIMINTVFALALAFSSYIILDLFVNKVLGVKSGFTGIKTAPIGACGSDDRAEGMTCGDNKICYTINYPDGPKAECVTECARKAIVLNQNWQCVVITPDMPYSEADGTLERGLCPGGVNNVCVLVVQ